MIFTTLRKLREVSACSKRYEYLKTKLGKSYGDDTPIDLTTILKHNGLDDALWVPISVLSGSNINQRYRLFAVACCQDISRLMKDQQSIDAVKISHLHAHGEATEQELYSARSAARSAAYSAADSAAYSAAYSAADSAADSAARSAAYSAADSAARSAAYTAARKRQAEHFKIIFSADFGE